MSGQQYFKISLLPTYYRFIKIIISETFGDFQTYIDQIYVMAQPKENSYIHELEVIDIERERKILSYFGHEISDNCHK